MKISKKSIIISVILIVILAATFIVIKIIPSKETRILKSLDNQINEKLGNKLSIESISLTEEELLDESITDIDEYVTVNDDQVVARSIYANSHTEILSIDEANCLVFVEAPDIFGMMVELTKGMEINADNFYQVQKELMVKITEKINSGDFATIKNELMLPITNGGVEATNEYYNAVYGGSVDAFLKLISEIYKEEK